METKKSSLQKETSAGTIIYYLDSDSKTRLEPKFLLLKYTNYWGFVKGLIEAGESIEQAARREAKEEANITQLEFIPKAKFTQNWMYKREGRLISKQAIFLLAKTNSAQTEKTKISFEHTDFGWFSYEQALKLLKIKSNREMVKAAYNFILNYEKQTKLI